MAVPKRKMSRANTRMRRGQWKASRPNLTTCQRCREPKLQHVACQNCGTYNNRRVEA
ncbi:50S ribosomal protein L32 [Lipingzhangella sp. LS1_29]|uniref:Large ribosomal subunit protein bL32 n=1 Tax=Lipingzhangella rawalii TaxID=2055835 RepID=A0ABU2H6M0_9ACTN|nr:50S ribosomal protein L32 [Lipingzhangella rawalii]MDS1270647.1 50S ribosomal protein L32 [Lipingzhangella rawalii]